VARKALEITIEQFDDNDIFLYEHMENLSVISGKWSLVTFANNADLHEEFYIFECNNYTKCVTNSISCICEKVIKSDTQKIYKT
jgi:hypothetical protein